MPKEPKTVVIFRAEKSGDFKDDVTAVFPELPSSDANPYEMMCYAPIGQHSGCSMEWYYGTRAATPAEYRQLARELRHIGYRLEVKRRITRAMVKRRTADYYNAKSR